eukprot:CAMPEP_0114520420 /NCGR_PEP_ID=MMETSP0109-20121206/19566_1 /TAXON_ID=29199 /ORGANISM="Chlorarachnion reptans, Strain CCCM449" /LENGTH=362 /DNA_ID=CAMNT_0001701303 /DNA_START=44 /DNA_END=1132 /DNA_ORIENTATION=-
MMASNKRALVATGAPGMDADSHIDKKIRMATALVPSTLDSKKQLIEAKGVLPRTSTLDAPTMLLTGHSGPVYACKFDCTGKILASGGQDKLLFLWKVEGKCENIATIKGNGAAILDIHWHRDNEYLLTACADKNGVVFDIETREKIKRLKGHQSFVNSICGSRRGDPIVVTASDDGTSKLWDLRTRGTVREFKDEKANFPVLACCFSDDSTQVFTGGIDEHVKCWDIRKESVVYKLEGHRDCVTGLELSKDGRYLLSNSMDNSMISWDVRPYVSTPRFTKQFFGHRHNMDKTLLKAAWSNDGSRVTGGSADRMVYIWDATDGRILYKLPGHAGSVNEIDFHPTEPIIVSCSNDKKIYVGEIM